MPPELARNLRRLMPSFFETVAAYSLMRASTSFCLSVCGLGRYSPLETICVGMGERRSSASSARCRPSSWSSLNHESSSREPGTFFGIAQPSGKSAAEAAHVRRRTAAPVRRERNASQCASGQPRDTATSRSASRGSRSTAPRRHRSSSGVRVGTSGPGARDPTNVRDAADPVTVCVTPRRTRGFINVGTVKLATTSGDPPAPSTSTAFTRPHCGAIDFRRNNRVQRPARRANPRERLRCF